MMLSHNRITVVCIITSFIFLCVWVFNIIIIEFDIILKNIDSRRVQNKCMYVESSIHSTNLMKTYQVALIIVITKTCCYFFFLILNQSTFYVYIYMRENIKIIRFSFVIFFNVGRLFSFSNRKAMKRVVCLVRASVTFDGN